MRSKHQTTDHDIAECDDCVTYLTTDHCRSKPASYTTAQRRAEKGDASAIPANRLDIMFNKNKVGGKVGNSFDFKEEQIEDETNATLNEDLIGMHMDMQLLSSL